MIGRSYFLNYKKCAAQEVGVPEVLLEDFLAGAREDGRLKAIYKSLYNLEKSKRAKSWRIGPNLKKYRVRERERRKEELKKERHTIWWGKTEGNILGGGGWTNGTSLLL